MELTIHYKDSSSEDILEVEKVLAASDVFPYWSIWYPEATDGKLKVRFISMESVEEVIMVGEKEEPQRLASVTPLHGGDDIGPIQED